MRETTPRPARERIVLGPGAMIPALRRRRAWGWWIAQLAGGLVLLGLGYAFAAAFDADVARRGAASAEAARAFEQTEPLGRPGRPELVEP